MISVVRNPIVVRIAEIKGPTAEQTSGTRIRAKDLGELIIDIAVPPVRCWRDVVLRLPHLVEEVEPVAAATLLSGDQFAWSLTRTTVRIA